IAEPAVGPLDEVHRARGAARGGCLARAEHARPVGVLLRGALPLAERAVLAGLEGRDLAPLPAVDPPLEADLDALDALARAGRDLALEPDHLTLEQSGVAQRERGRGGPGCGARGVRATREHEDDGEGGAEHVAQQSMRVHRFRMHSHREPSQSLRDVDLQSRTSPIAVTLTCLPWSRAVIVTVPLRRPASGTRMIRFAS